MTQRTSRQTLYGGVKTITLTGTQNDVDFSNVALLRCDNATDLTITGFKSGFPGQLLAVVSVGAGNVFFTHQATSTADCRLINYATTGNTPLAAGSGSATYQYDGTTARWRLISHTQGAAIRMAFAAGNFTASAGNWTVASGDVLVYDYILAGRQLLVLYSLTTTSVSATPFQLRLATPGGFTSGAAAAACTSVAVQYNEAGTWIWNGGAELGTGVINLYKALAATNWSTTVNLTDVKGTLLVEVL